MRCSGINTMKLKCMDNKQTRNEISKKNACKGGCGSIQRHAVSKKVKMILGTGWTGRVRTLDGSV